MTQIIPQPLGWIGIVRLGLVLTSLGAIVVLTTSTLNRVMVVELGLIATLPGALVAMHHAMQMLRPRWGYGSDIGGRRTPWIVGGLVVLALGGFGAAVATAWMMTDLTAGIILAVVSFLLIGIGGGASGTSLLVLLAKRVDERRRAAAASIVWTMMIFGFVITATTAGHFLDPFSPTRLVMVVGCVCAIAVIVTWLAVWGVEGTADPRAAYAADDAQTPPTRFFQALRQVWHEPQARRFTIFVFVSMLAYSAQDLILEPFAGIAFGFTPGESTKLAGVQNAGVLLGMLLVGIAASSVLGPRIGTLRGWTIVGCLASGVALFGLTMAGFIGAGWWPLRINVFLLGVSNGVFAVAAIGSMMALAGIGQARREGVRMGLWGAAQAIAMGGGGFLGAVSVDLARGLVGTPVVPYALVFAAEATMFMLAAWLASRIDQPSEHGVGFQFVATNDASVAELGGR